MARIMDPEKDIEIRLVIRRENFEALQHLSPCGGVMLHEIGDGRYGLAALIRTSADLPAPAGSPDQASDHRSAAA